MVFDGDSNNKSDCPIDNTVISLTKHATLIEIDTRNEYKAVSLKIIQNPPSGQVR